MAKDKAAGKLPTEYGAAEELLKKALERPGVQDVFSVYEKWKTADSGARPLMKSMGIKRVVSLSNSSDLKVS